MSEPRLLTVLLGLSHAGCRDQLEGTQGKAKKRSIHEMSYDALIQFASTSRVFYVQIAKMIHNPSRRREDMAGSPSLPMQTAAAVVSITMRDALTSVQDLVSSLFWQTAFPVVVHSSILVEV